MTSRDLLRFGIIDDVISEPLGGAHRDHREAAASLKSYLIQTIRQLKEIPIDKLLDRRYEKYRKIGVFLESRRSRAKRPVARSVNGCRDSRPLTRTDSNGTLNQPHTFAGTTNGARYSRVSIASASESFTNDSVDGLICSLRPSR